MELAASKTYRQFVIFRLGNEEYGIETLKVRHIEELMAVTRVPGAPDYIKGVINLRGEIIPVMDLRRRFHMDELKEDENTRIIILTTDDINAGLIVDEVNETLQISEDNIDNIAIQTVDPIMEYVSGVGKAGNRVITILNVEKLLKI